PMNDPMTMRLGNAARDLCAELNCLIERQGAPSQPVLQRLSLEVLHDEKFDAVLVAHVIKRADVRMRELRDRFRLSLQALPALRRRGHALRQQLDRDIPAQARASRSVNLTHPSCAEGREQLVRTELGT